MRAMWLALFLAMSGPLVGEFTPEWNKPLQPYRVIGNIYYVGTNYLASFLITTPEGLILINPDYEQSVPLIKASVEKLGYKFSDIKILLISHAHDDHAAGCASIKQQTHARLMVMDADVSEIESGGKGDFQYHQHWTPVKVDRILHDGEAVTLGNVTLRAHLTPGHTRGCTTWTTDVRDSGRTLHVVIVGSANVNPGYKLVGNKEYSQIAADYEKTFRVLKSLPCDVFLGAHGEYYNMDEKLKRLQAGEGNPFIDPQGYRDFVAAHEQAFLAEYHAQQKSAGGTSTVVR